MVNLRPKSPCAGKAPVRHGDVTLTELPFVQITSVAPFNGREAAVSKILKASTGAGLPDTGRLLVGGTCEVLWAGQGQFFVAGAPVPSVEAAVTDQSDAWVTLGLDGAQAGDVLARLCPLDLRGMDEGDVARSLVGHIACVIIGRSGGFEIMAFRSMAGTLWCELETAMQSVAARAGLVS